MAANRQPTGSRASDNRADRPKPAEADATEQAREKRAEFLTARQLAEMLQVSETTVHRLRREGKIPALMLTGRLIRFNLKDVKQALKLLQSSRAQTDGATSSEPSPQLSFGDLFSDFNE